MVHFPSIIGFPIPVFLESYPCSTFVFAPPGWIIISNRCSLFPNFLNSGFVECHNEPPSRCRQSCRSPFSSFDFPTHVAPDPFRPLPVRHHRSEFFPQVWWELEPLEDELFSGRLAGPHWPTPLWHCLTPFSPHSSRENFPVNTKNSLDSSSLSVYTDNRSKQVRSQAMPKKNPPTGDERDLNLSTMSVLFSNEDLAREVLEKLRWPDGPVCPHCGEVNNAYRLEPKKSKKDTHVRKGV